MDLSKHEQKTCLDLNDTIESTFLIVETCKLQNNVFGSRSEKNMMKTPNAHALRSNMVKQFL